MFLPFESQSLDAAAAARAGVRANPHQVLREAERVLRPEGRLCWPGSIRAAAVGAGAHRIQGGECGYPWNGSSMNISRVKDWMALLVLEVAAGSMCCYRRRSTAQTGCAGCVSWNPPAIDEWGDGRRRVFSAGGEARAGL